MRQYSASISTAKLVLTDRLRGKLIHKPGRDELKRELNQLSYTHLDTISFTSVILRSRIERFSEQMVADAERELAAYFAFRTGRALKVSYTDLRYFVKGDSTYLFNKSVAAAVGEGLAGFLVQRFYNFIPQARPLGLSPDIIMQRDDEVAFVEAKAILTAGRASMAGIMNEAAIDIMGFLTTAPYLRPRVYCGFIVGTEIYPEDRFDCRILEIAQ